MCSCPKPRYCTEYRSTLGRSLGWGREYVRQWNFCTWRFCNSWRGSYSARYTGKISKFSLYDHRRLATLRREIIRWIIGIFNPRYHTTVEGRLFDVWRKNTRFVWRQRGNHSTTIIEESLFTKKTSTLSYEIYIYFPNFSVFLPDSVSSSASNV